MFVTILILLVVAVVVLVPIVALLTGHGIIKLVLDTKLASRLPIRKRVKVGPFALCLSKEGWGVHLWAEEYSPLVVGIRVASGDTSYLRKNGGWEHRRFSVKSNSSNEEFTDISRDAFLEEVNRRIYRPSLSYGIAALTLVIAFVLACNTVSSLVTRGLDDRSIYESLSIAVFGIVLPLAIFALGMWTARITRLQEQWALTTSADFVLAHEVRREYQTLEQVLGMLTKSTRIWHILLKEPTWDWRKNAGASWLVTREAVDVNRGYMAFLETTERVHSMSFRHVKLFFLPDQVLVLRGKTCIGMGYDTIRLEVATTTFVEEEDIDDRVVVLSHTWRFPRKDGGPDLRFNGNRKLPLVQYGSVSLYSSTGFRLDLQFSNCNIAEQFASSLRDYAGMFQPKHVIVRAFDHQTSQSSG